VGTTRSTLVPAAGSATLDDSWNLIMALPSRLLAIVLAVMLGLAGRAAAQPAAAELAFRKARALMKDGKTAEACDAFAQSQRLDPQLGTQYNLGLCLAKLGKTASAWIALREVAQRDTNRVRRAQAAAKADALEPMLVKVSLVVRALVPGLAVTSNGDDITRLVGVEFPVDPGSYQIVARAAGYSDYTTTVVAEGAGTAIAISIPELTRIPEPVKLPEAPAAPAAQPAPLPRAPEPVVAPAAPSHGRRRTIGIVVGGTGVAALAAGAVAGVLARDQWNAAKATCGAAVRCDSAADYTSAQRAVDSARLRGNLATGLVAAGTIAVGAGVALWLTAPREVEQPRAAWRIAPAGDGRSFTVLLDGGF
jgi:hypothetical protein